MERPLVKLAIYFFGISGAVLIFLALVFLPKLDSRVLLTCTLVWRVILDVLQSLIISRRTFQNSVQLPYRVAVWDVVGQIVLVGLIVWIFIYSDDHTILSVLLIVNIMSQVFMLPQYLKRSPRFVITQDKLLVNTFNLNERNLSDLHSIELRGWFQKIRIRFAEELDIKLPKGPYTNAERAVFLRELIDRAPVDPELDSRMIEFLDRHAPLTSAST